MFITDTRYLSPFSAFQCEPGQQSWLLGELEMHRPWFLVTMLDTDPADPAYLVKRTFFTSSAKQVVVWAKQETTEQIQFESALLAIPDTQNGKSTWKMEPLDSMWLADEPMGLPGYPIEVCQTQSGARYVISISGTPQEQLVNYKLSYQFPA